MAKKILSYFVSVMMVVVFVVPFFVQAQGVAFNPGGSGQPNPGGSGPSGPIVITNPLNNIVDIPSLINAIINNILLPIGGVVAVLMVMWAGFLYVTARGDTAKLKDARNALLWAVIGAAILLGAKVISDVIGKTVSQIRGT